MTLSKTILIFSRTGLLAILLLLGALAVFTPPVHAQHQTLTGWFTMTIVDYQTEAGLTAETTYFLTEDSGERHELLIDIDLMRPLGGPVTLNRKRVTVMGEWEEVGPGAIEKFRVSSIELVPSPSTALPGRTVAPDLLPDEPLQPRPMLQAAQTDSHVRGSQAWVNILCRFADLTDYTPYPASSYEGLTRSPSEPSPAHYWKEVSDGNIPDLRGSIVVGWYNLPQPHSYYIYDQDGDGEEDFDAERLGRDCTDAADADVFFPDFDGINMFFNGSLGVAGFGGSTFLTKDGEGRLYGETAISLSGGASVLAHEMGHAFGLQHSSGPYGQDDPPFSPTTYDSGWDVMSGGFTHTIAYHKDFLGWIPPDRKYVATPNTTRTITLERLAKPGAEGYLMAQIPIGGSDTDFYTVEARLFAGYDDGIPDEAIVIHKVDTTLGDRLAQVVDIDNNGDPNDEGAMWTPGEIFTDSENNLQVSIDAAYATGYRVTINTNPDTFTTCIDFLSASSHLFGPGRDGASVQVTAASDCRWSVTSNTDWIRVPDGESSSGPGSVSYTVAANPNPTARISTLTVGGWTITVTQAGVNDTLFADNMENGANGWSGHAPWAQTTTTSRSGTYAWTDSPNGNYQNDLTISLWSPVIDLTETDAATLTFWHRYDLASGDRGLVFVGRLIEDTGRWGVEEKIGSFHGTQPTWQQASIDLTPFVGESVRLAFLFSSDATKTADGWYIDDVAVFSTDFVSPVTLENPRAASFQSGVGVISGWACHAHAISIELNGVPYQAGYPTTRTDTQGRCGDSDNGFSLLWNWNNLGPGEHTVRALIDGQEFANRTVRVTTFGEQVLRGVSGTFPLSDFPHVGDTTRVQWAESLQNFVITDGSAPGGGGHASVAGMNARLENPALGAAQSGVSAISGWACEADEIVIELNGVPYRAGYPTTRTDTQGVCGDSANGFSLLWNWNNLGPGTHTVRALLDGVEFANTTVRVTTLGEQVLRGVSGTFPLADFPQTGDTTRIRWEESLQNFVIIP